MRSIAGRFFHSELFCASHRPLIHEPTNSDAEDEAKKDTQVIDDTGAEGHIVVLGDLCKPVANENVDKEFRGGNSGSERKGARGDARDRGKKSVAKRER
ncbi:hypothetical protein RRF57_005836 [Xylaria bambusicola]|uniref:Uncharacterized protein n=1 Tax=Xylaria bambusicola TaxID=326684 RepID=A0AAN7UP84_9PEZI